MTTLKDNLLEIIVCSMKIYLYYLFYKTIPYFGWLVVIILLGSSYNHLIWKLYKLERLNHFDKFFVTKNKIKQCTVPLLLTFDDFNEEKMKYVLLNRLILKIRKYRCRLVYRFLDYYWQEMPFSLAAKKIEESEIFIVNSEEELKSVYEKEITRPIDIFNTLPWEAKMIKFRNSSKGALLFKFDHVMSDGFGVIFSFCYIADNFSFDLFPRNAAKVDFPLGKYIKDIIELPKLMKERRELTKNVEHKLIKKDYYHTDEILAARSKIYNFPEWGQIAKSLKITFNDLVLTVIMAAFYEYYQREKITPPPYLSFAIPIGKKGLPKRVEDVPVKNSLAITEVHLPLIKNAGEEYTIISNLLRRSIRNEAKAAIRIGINYFFNDILPLFFTDWILGKAEYFMDSIVSNVPGPRHALIFDGMEMKRFIPIPNPGRLFSFLPVVSYNNTLEIIFTIDKIANCDPKKIIDLIDEKFNELRESKKTK
jgi:hypothetical protein